MISTKDIIAQAKSTIENGGSCPYCHKQALPELDCDDCFLDKICAVLSDPERYPIPLRITVDGPAMRLREAKRVLKIESMGELLNGIN